MRLSLLNLRVVLIRLLCFDFQFDLNHFYHRQNPQPQLFNQFFILELSREPPTLFFDTL